MYEKVKEALEKYPAVFAVVTDPMTFYNLLQQGVDKSKIRMCPFLPGTGKVYIMEEKDFKPLENAMYLWYKNTEYNSKFA